MTITVASHAGFCFGVRRATEAVEDALRQGGSRIFTLGRLIHNDGYCASLAARGVVGITPEELPDVLRLAGTGERVTMSGTPFRRDSQGVYGILARDNAEAAFVNVDDITTGFYATRCYIKLSGGNTALLTTNHIGADDGSTNVADLLTPGERVTVYNISGVPVATDATISDLNRLQPGIYTIKGKKVTISR